MTQILSAQQQKQLDSFTIAHEPISSVELMNRAAWVFYTEIEPQLQGFNNICVVCGTGNNGGDGLVVYRLLRENGYTASCYLVPFGTMSTDCQAQFNSVQEDVILWDEQTNPELGANTLIVDALLGIGSNREPTGLLQNVIQWMNTSGETIYSIDMPSGLPSDELPAHELIVHADATYTFHAPKLTFFLPETAYYAGIWKVLDIGLDQDESKRQRTRYQQQQITDISQLIPERSRFSHKGTYGHALLIAGSDGKMGACMLSSEATLRSGVGLLTVHTVAQGRYSFHQRIPEAMAVWDVDELELSGTHIPDLSRFSAIGIGPGLGTGKGTLLALEVVLKSQKACVIDADALNVLSMNPDLLELLHEHCVLTPHPKEFERLAGSFNNSLERLDRAIHFAQAYGCQLILKDAITAIINSQGEVTFNTTGNSGMATGGSGDVLTGVVLGLLTQGIPTYDAARIAVFHHGLAGDKAKEQYGERAMLPRDIIANLLITKH